MKERILVGSWNRILQILARMTPGAKTWRVRFHRWRGVNIGKDVWIGYDCILETAYPHLISIGDRSIINVRTTIIAHFQELNGVHIEDDVFIGPGVIILPNLRIGRGAVVSAGSVVTTSVAPWTVVQGNPARPIAKSSIALGMSTSIKEFLGQLRPLSKNQRVNARTARAGSDPRVPPGASV